MFLTPPISSTDGAQSHAASSLPNLKIADKVTDMTHFRELFIYSNPSKTCVTTTGG
jgi:hypothetical protein